MIKKVCIVLTLLLIPYSASAAGIISFIYEMDSSYQSFNEYVNSQASSVRDDLDDLREGTIQDIGKEIKRKSRNAQSLMNLSIKDNTTNQEIIFLLKKINEVHNVGVELVNTTTAPNLKELVIK